MSPQDKPKDQAQQGKIIVGKEVAQYAKNGQVIGIGTGSTVDAAIEALSLRVKNEGLQFTVVPTSYQTAWRCEELGLTVRGQNAGLTIDWGFDGADAVDKKGHAIKGKGAALLEEKILARKCSKYFLIVDDSKMCLDVCNHSAVPVEVFPSAKNLAIQGLQALGAKKIELRDGRPGKHGPVITEHGNVIFDVTFASFREGLEKEIKAITGVVESGLFEKVAHVVIISRPDGVETITL